MIQGRSYGVMASVGLINSFSNPRVNISRSAGFTFNETGYLSTVDCYYNTSSELELTPVNGNENVLGNSPRLFGTNCSLPNESVVESAVFAFANNRTIVCVASVRDDGRYMYGVATCFGYQNFTNLQCNVTFTPSIISVLVDVARSNISVTPLETSTVAEIEPTRLLKNVSFHQVQYISEAVTTIYTSFIDQSSHNNVANIQARENHPYITAMDVTNGVAKALELFIDNSLSIYGAAQMMLAGDTANAMAKVQLIAVKLGEPVYVYIIFGIGLAIMILVAYMAL